ncbi:histidine phosphatase family protein [Nocardioides sp. KR10-350]|uniref:histidine phosphatase family protein n=1 Tax=Nocardioides cheoyonin TaxID=3156615 RepID=UPI0032B4457A
MRLLLIRHGQTPNNVAGALDTARPGAGLTPLGEAQAGAIPVALAEEEIAAVYASVLVRTQLTAAPLAAARGLEVRVVEGLEEIAAGDLEMHTEKESVKAYVDSLGRWAHGDLGHAMPGGPDGHAFFERYDAAIRDIHAAHPDDTVVAVSHGAAIRLWTATRAVNVGPEHAIEQRLMNTGLAVLEGSPDDGWTLVRWQSEPLGGLDLEDLAAHDVTGEPGDEAVAEAE